MKNTWHSSASAPGLMASMMLLAGLLNADAGAAVARPPAPKLIAYQALTYDATIAGVPAGTARVAVLRHKDGYRIAGQAKAEGLLDALSPWRTRFAAHGRLLNGQPMPEQFQYLERGGNNTREVRVAAGQLTVNKNGQPRSAGTALPGLDVLAALFASDECQAELDLHTGRQGYRLTSQSVPMNAASAPAPELSRLSSNGDDAEIQECVYQATNEDADSYGVEIRLTHLDGQPVPLRIALHGTVAGVLSLRDSQLRTVACETAEGPALDYLCHLTPLFNPSSGAHAPR